MRLHGPGDPERNREIVRLREHERLRFREIAGRFGLKAGYVREIYGLMKLADEFREGPESLGQLSVRTVKLLSDMGIRSIADLGRFISSSPLWKDAIAEKCSPRVADEVQAFAIKNGILCQ